MTAAERRDKGPTEAGQRAMQGWSGSVIAHQPLEADGHCCAAAVRPTRGRVCASPPSRAIRLCRMGMDGIIHARDGRLAAVVFARRLSLDPFAIAIAIPAAIIFVPASAHSCVRRPRFRPKRAE